MKQTVVIIVSTILFYCCGKPNNKGRICTMEAKAGLQISVRNTKTNFLIKDSIEVIATAGSYTEALQPMSDTTFVGAWERPDTYYITVKGNKIKTATSGALIVSSDGCHVNNVSITMSIEPK